jgi:hypothetical protein
MRRIVMFNRIAADGSFAGHNDSLEWIVPEQEIDKAGAEATSAFDTILDQRGDETGLFENPKGRDLEELTPLSRARAKRDRKDETTAGQEHDCLR